MRAMLTTLLIVIGIAGAFYATLSLLLYLEQDRVLFYPRTNDSQLLAEWQASKVEIPSNDVTLEGWWTDNPASTTPFVILYFGGNAEDVLYTAGIAERINARRMLVVNYRGYGTTPGEPSQEALYEDGLAVYDYAVSSQSTRPENLIAMGRSLGSGVASMLAAKRPVRAAILITPFDSMRSVAQAHYPIFPVKLLLKHPFDSLAFAQRTNVPALILAAQLDGVIPPEHAQSLADSWAGAETFHLLSDVGHNDLEQHDDYFPLINEFLNGLQR